MFAPCVAGTTAIGIKYKGTLEVANLSDENDMDDLDVSLLTRASRQ
jgi:hypothetical protein